MFCFKSQSWECLRRAASGRANPCATMETLEQRSLMTVMLGNDAITLDGNITGQIVVSDKSIFEASGGGGGTLLNATGGGGGTGIDASVVGAVSPTPPELVVDLYGSFAKGPGGGPR